jgi:hypothetical protein
MPTEEETQDQASEAGARRVDISATKHRRPAFSKLPRELDEQELESPVARKFLIDTVDRLEDENQSLRHFQDEFYQTDKKAGILEEKLKLKLATDVMSAVCLSVGWDFVAW